MNERVIYHRVKLSFFTFIFQASVRIIPVIPNESLWPWEPREYVHLQVKAYLKDASVLSSLTQLVSASLCHLVVVYDNNSHPTNCKHTQDPKGKDE